MSIFRGKGNKMFEYVRIKKLKAGDVVAKNIYDDKSHLLIRKGNALTDRSISVIKEFGYKGVYIQVDGDTISGDVSVPEPVVDDITQLRVISILRDIYYNKEYHMNPYEPNFMKSLKLLEVDLRDMIHMMIDAKLHYALLFEAEDNRSKNNWLFYHLVNVCMLSIGIGISLGLTEEELFQVALGAVLHDMGKSWFADDVVNGEKLSKEKKKLLRDHTTEFFRILQRCQYPVNVTYAVWQHHEKLDGSGYPNGLLADKILLSARIVAVANAYDNMINLNPYNHEPIYQSDALECMCASTEFDVDCVRGLMAIVAPYPVGCHVLLSNNETALVIQNRVGLPLRPVVMIKTLEGRKYIDMSNNDEYRSVIVTQVLE